MDPAYPYLDEPSKFESWFRERLQEIPGIEWDNNLSPVHSTYEDWYVWGTRVSSDNGTSGKTSVSSRPASPVPSIEYSVRSASQGPRSVTSVPSVRQGIVARVSKYTLRLERQYQLGESFIEKSDPQAKHHVRAIQLLRLPARRPGEVSLAVIIIEHPGGHNDLRRFMNFGPAWFLANRPPALYPWNPKLASDGQSPVGSCTINQFLDFAIGASSCVELLHRDNRIIHGELRGDSFYFNEATGSIKWISYGTDIRSFEHGLTSAGWSALTRQFGVEHKLQFVAPEQTGRLPAAPDSRTDIYSLGIIFFNFLTGELPFAGETPLEIMQNVLSRRIPRVSDKRIEVPDALSDVVQKMVQRDLTHRYHSAAALKYDLEQIQKFLTEGDSESLRNFKVGLKNDNFVFNLPNTLIGRENEQKAALSVIERATKHQKRVAAPVIRSHSPISSESSASLGRRDSESHTEDYTSDRGSTRSKASYSHSFQQTQQQSDTLDEQTEEVSSSASPKYYHRPFRLSIDTPASDFNAHSSLSSNTDDAIQMIRNPQRWKRGGRCEIIAVTGVGKSSFTQSIQPIARSYGYFCMAKFDRNGGTPFQPVLNLMTGLFRQIFSETDINTDFHNSLRAFCRPFWSLLHGMLGLPEWLMEPARGSSSENGTSVLPNYERNRANTSGSSIKRPGSPLAMRPSNDSGSTIGANTTNELLRSGPSAKNSRFMAIFVDILRVISLQKLIIFCLDDMHFADDESLDLLLSIAQSKISMVMLASYREAASLASKCQNLLSYDAAMITNIKLHHLTEEQVTSYVANTLHRSRDYVFPLVAIILEKTQGNPFFIREMLEACYRERCLWYSWDDSAWTFNIDKVFRTFESSEYGSQINNDFLVNRLKSLPPHCRSLLAWASLIGSEFSFSLVKTLMRTSVLKDCEWPSENDSRPVYSGVQRVDLVRQSSQDAIQGLQICLENFIIMAGEDDDHFRFGHDRYQRAANSLTECSSLVEMHFSIARVMIADEHGTESIYTKCNHIVSSVDLIMKRVVKRAPYRKLLRDAAAAAIESGGRTAALSYYATALRLLQDDPWNDTLPDVEYMETMDIYLRCSECYWFQGNTETSIALLDTFYNKAKETVDKVPAWILKSRILVRKGDNVTAMLVLRHCLAQLGVTVEYNSSWEECDAKSIEIQNEFEAIPHGELLGKAISDDKTLDAISAVICEMLGAAFWIESLFLYKLALMGMDIILHRGATSQAGVLIAYFATTVITRFNKVELGCELANVAKGFFHKYSEDLFSVGRGQNLCCMLLNHFSAHIAGLVPILENSLFASISSGDRIAAILNVGFTASLKVWSSYDMTEIEHFCTYGAEELEEWQDDFRGGVFIISVRQFARALQGKTNYMSASQIFTDEEHATQKYCQKLQEKSTGKGRSWNAYTHFQMSALFLFGHYHAAIKLASPTQSCYIDDTAVPAHLNTAIEGILQSYWSSRFGVHTSYYLGLAYMAILRDDPGREDAESMLSWTRTQRDKLKKWSVVNDVNFHIFRSNLDAQLEEHAGNYESATRFYESALDHAEVHGFTFDAALTSELYAEFLIRRGANRPAANAIRDAISHYRRISAVGKASHVARKHEWLVKGTSSLDKVDAACQTMESGPSYPEHVDVTNLDQAQTKPQSALQQPWSNPFNVTDSQKVNSQLESLDVIDITSILKASEVLSSELQIDKLLDKMTKIILDSTGGELCAIVVQDPERDADWRVAAISDREGNEYPAGEALEVVDDVVGKQVTLYCLRFKESVFLNNVLNDERFSNVSEAYRRRNPGGKSVIAMPILHSDQVIRGCLYLEGPVNSFTKRNAAVLQLLVTPVSISITNAMLFKRAEKVSASNAVMLEAQKYALSQARISEKKAKKAEAEAMRNARLKEEAAAAKSMFLASVSHELRTPLNGVIGMSELLKQTTLNSEQESYADSIRVCADTLLTVINDILDFSKLEAGKMRVFSVPLNLRETIFEVVRALSYGNMEKDLRTVMQLDINEDLLVIADPIRLHQVMMNLLSNAFKFCPSGTITVKAVVEREDDDEIEVTCSVSDTGIGIAEEQKQRLFLPFSQADNSTARTYGGTGLGLTICKAIIENLMKGKIWLESKVNVGTTVSFRLTFAKVGAGAASQAPKLMTAADPMAVYSPEGGVTPAPNDKSTMAIASVPRDKLRICIAEDNPINQKIAISFVQKLGFRCSAYNDGRQAVDALAAAHAEGDPFGIVLMDCQMPVLDGYDATREIRKHPEPAVRDVIIIAMTASAIRGDREKCLEAGMNNYLAKPVRQQGLKQMLDGYVNAAEQQPVAAVTTTTTTTTTSTTRRVLQKRHSKRSNGFPTIATLNNSTSNVSSGKSE